MNHAVITALLWGACSLFAAQLAHARGRTNPMFFGNFSGISPVHARNGATLNESAVSFSLNGAGLTFGLGVDRAGREWKIRYGSEWFMNVLEAQSNCVYIAQDLRAHDFSYLLCFELGRNGRAIAATMTKPNELVQTRYVKVGERTRATRETIRELYEHLYQAPTLLGINEANDLIQGSAPTADKIAMLRRLKIEFRNFNDDQLARFEPLVASALESGDAGVQRAALEVFAATPTFTNLKHVMTLSEDARLSPGNVEPTIRALGWYLHQINEREAMRDTVAAAFGSDDIDYVWEKTKGVVPAKDMKALGDLLTLDRARTRGWTEAQREDVRARLREYAALATRAEDRKAASRVLRAWEPSVACAESLSTIRRALTPPTSAKN